MQLNNKTVSLQRVLKSEPFDTTATLHSVQNAFSIFRRERAFPSLLIPIMAHTGRPHLKKVPFSGFRYMRKGIHKVYERVGNSVISVSKKAQKG